MGFYSGLPWYTVAWWWLGAQVCKAFGHRKKGAWKIVRLGVNRSWTYCGRCHVRLSKDFEYGPGVR